MTSQRKRFLPTSTAELLQQTGRRRPHVLLVSGDAYVDHPAFGAALVGRLLQSWGLDVVLLAQPDWRDPASLEEHGPPLLFVGISAGNMDSMVNHMTALLKRRHDDAYSPGGRHGLRPNRASIVYAQLARRAFPDRIIVLGGLEASLRRLAHYDVWEDRIRRSVLLDARADLLVHGMAERPLRAIVDRLAPLHEVDRRQVSRLFGIRGTAFVLGQREARARGLALQEGERLVPGAHGWAESGPSLPAGGAFRDPPGPLSWRIRRLPSFDSILGDRALLARATRLAERSQNPGRAEACVQRHGQAYVIVSPPAWPLTTDELDLVHELPYQRAAHPRCGEPVPAAEMIQGSIQVLRGCFGGCTFCSLALHEGRAVQSRSLPSVLREVRALQQRPFFHGIISDLGGTTANLYAMTCREPAVQGRCRRPSCLHPRPCPLLVTDHGPLRRLMRAVREAPGVRHAFVASGIRHDLVLLDGDGYLEDLVRHHTGGHLHVAPEHTDPLVLRLARKPPYEIFERFQERFEQVRRRLGQKVYLSPYFMSGLPGSTDARMEAAVAALREQGWRPRQVQCFLPTPGTVATAMFYAGINPDREQERVQMPRTPAERSRQHALLTQDLSGS